MIRKISVAMYIHTLKYGALASKGHAVAVPQDMKIFTNYLYFLMKLEFCFLKVEISTRKNTLLAGQLLKMHYKHLYLGLGLWLRLGVRVKFRV